MREQATLGLLAVGLGVVLSVVLFIPFVAHSYRRWGRFSAVRGLAWSAALAYFWAIWTYTLLPLPDPEALACAPRNTTFGAFLDDLRAAVAGASGRRELLLDPAVLQVGLNVLLFVPLGFFLRFLGGRGVVAAVLVGFALSGFVEVTQLTGVWGLYPCAYRVFDVDDLVLNTAGALIGSILAFVVPRRHRGRAHRALADVPTPVTRPRRLLGMVCDLLGFTLVSLAVTVGVRAVLLYVLDEREAALDGPWPDLAGIVVPLVAWLWVTLATGRTVGDLAVRVRYTGGPLPVWLARAVRFLAGVGAYGLLMLVPGTWSAGFVVVAGLVAIATPRGRGLPG
ncbi:MAG: VanZ family protein, partial [Actinomycetales bacterium]|nr:VanZ family protein [Actinomycetales bacterium]